MINSTLFTSLLSLCTIFTLTACGGSIFDSNGLPKWVSETPDLCGVGIQKVRGNRGAARVAANAKGRTALSYQLETKVKAMVKDYNAEGGTTDGDISEEMTKMASVNLTKTTMNGAIPKKGVYNEKNQQFYALVCLNPGVLTEAIGKMNQLSAAQRKALERRAAKAHEDLAKAMESYDD